MLSLEDQIMADVSASAEGELGGDLVLGASTGPAAIAVPLLLCEFQRESPGVRVFLTVSDTHAVVERVATRELELGSVGAARRHRGVRFEPFFSDEVILACPPGHRFSGRTISLDELREESIVLMQEGAGVRQVVEDALRRQGVRLRDLDVRLELGLQESVRAAVEAGYGVTFISRTAVEAGLEAGTLAEAHVEGMAASARSRSPRRRAARSRVADAFVEFAQQSVVVIVRWGSTSSARSCASSGSRACSSRAALRSLELPSPRASPAVQALAARDGRGGDVGRGRLRRARGRRGRSAIDTAKAVSAGTGLRLIAVPTTYSGAEWTPYFGMRDEVRGLKTGGSGARTAAAVYEPSLTLDLPLGETVGTALNALAHAPKRSTRVTARTRRPARA
jgi:DNA-binding transcriptional LysR family regulator